MKRFNLIFIFIFILLFLTTTLFAGEGVIIVHEAPLFLKPDKASTVVDRFRKDDVIYIHRKHFIDYEEVYNSISSTDQFSTPELLVRGPNTRKPPFYTTVDRNGNTAYVPAEYVKLILNDHRESYTHLPSIKDDETDYRLIEPIKERFPFIIPGHNGRSLLSIACALQNTQTYPYPKVVERRERSFPLDLNIAYSLPMNWWENSQHIFLGGLFALNYHEETYFLSSGISSQELHWKIALGPLITYDTYRRMNYQVSYFFTPLIFVMDQTTITQNESANKRDDRNFSSLHLGLRAGVYYQQIDLFGDNKDLSTGVALQWIPPHNPSSEQPGRRALWGDSGSFKKNAEVSLLFFMGAQTRPN